MNECAPVKDYPDVPTSRETQEYKAWCPEAGVSCEEAVTITTESTPKWAANVLTGHHPEILGNDYSRIYVSLVDDDESLWAFDVNVVVELVEVEEDDGD